MAAAGFLSQSILNPGLNWVHTLVSAQNKEGNLLFNDALNTFYLHVYGVRHMVKDHSDRERKPAAATWVTLSD